MIGGLLMGKKTLGKVTPEEANTIMLLFSRKKALEELLPTLDLEKNERLYEKVIADLSATNAKIMDWWKTVSGKYSWEFANTDSWWIDFETSTVSLT
jgi:CXXX repeat modification system protein